ncbi:hypothetical protein F5Y10DRAFT_228969 [Nemania abortiva]|nr:hypothetical protein F5Y10DRAFT_228969 [Nemania abortiva]
MPTLFICRECTARLARRAYVLLRSEHRLLHTRVIPPQRPSQDVIPLVNRGRRWEPNVLQSERQNGDAVSATSFPSSEGQDDETGGTTRHRGGRVWKFVPKTPLSVQRLGILPPTDSIRELKAKILCARGNYRVVHEDLVRVYGLSHSEARHAVGQLERLLWGHLDMDTAASRLDRYLSWKKDISAALRNAAAVSSIQDVNSSIGDASTETTSHASEKVSMKTAWQRLDKDRRELLWSQMVLSTLDSEPHTLPTLIQSTFDPSWCPSYVVEDLLYVLFRRCHLALQRGAQGNCIQMQKDIEAIVTFVLNKSPPRYLALEQTVLQMTLPALPTTELNQRNQLLRTIEHPVHAHTLLHIASRFAKSFDTKGYAVDILRILTDMPGFDLNTPAAASVCTSLLTLNENEPLPDEQAAPDILIEFLLERGLRPNLLVLSALMRNFCVRGHLDTAWTVFDLMLQYGLEPDQHVYSILLNGSKRNPGDASLEHIFNIITSRNAWSPVLVNDYLDLLFRENESQLEQRRRQRKANNAWRPMLQLYAKFYDLAPLQKFTLFPLENLVKAQGVEPKYSTPSIRMAESLMPQPDTKLMQPDSVVLCLMIGAHMRSLLTPKYAIRYYRYFCKLVGKKDPAALGLLAEHGTLVYDIFIRTLMQFRATSGFAVEEVEKMVLAANKEKARDGRNLYHHPPSIYTWGILLNGLKNHNDIRNALAVFNMMTTIGQVRPTLPIWNAFIQTLARAGSVSGVVKAIWSLKQAGLQPNDRTIKAISMLPRRLRDKVIAELEEMRRAPEKFSIPRALPLDPTKLGASNIKGTHNIPVDNHVRRPLAIPRNLKELAGQLEALDIRKIERPRKRQQQVNSNLPLGLLR